MTEEVGERFADLFRATYLTFHRRDRPRGHLASASRAVLEHLAMAGPLTIGEAALHLERAQSVVSEIVSHLVQQGLLERESDPADRRRTLVWLTPAGHETLRRDRDVLDVARLGAALSRLPPGQADALIEALSALVDRAAPRRSVFYVGQAPAPVRLPPPAGCARQQASAGHFKEET